MKLNSLTKEEAKVIQEKGTEKPYSGEYEDFDETGIYLCRRCNQPLYRSEDKFDANCGWPSFDDEIEGAVERKTDADGMHTEIMCNNCSAHLGHVFTGEMHTEKNTRHCVNSLSMHFLPADFKADETRSAVLAGGCFWCLEATFEQLKGVKSVTNGYAGGKKTDPNYDEVCSGTTGHAEVVKIEFDESVIDFKTLLEVFFATHDPTTLNRQGNDVGEQYRSMIFYQTVKQKQIAEDVINQLEKEKVFKDKIVTEVIPLIKFYEAEKYHQDYYTKNPEEAYCQAVINPKLKKFRDKFEKLIK